MFDISVELGQPLGVVIVTVDLLEAGLGILGRPTPQYTSNCVTSLGLNLGVVGSEESTSLAIPRSGA